MQKITVILSSLLIAIVLVWCTTDENTSENKNSDSFTWTISEKHTWVNVCDNYLTTLKCLSESATGTSKQSFDSSYKSLIQSFQNVPAEQLTQTCNTLSEWLRTNPTLLKDHPNCNTL